MCLNSGGNDNGQNFFFKKFLEGGKMTEGITVFLVCGILPDNFYLCKVFFSLAFIY